MNNTNYQPTERLRAMLDERGVEWGNIRNDGSKSDYITEWQFEDNQGKAVAIEWAIGSDLSVEIYRYNLTPEQAIVATLGAGTCHDVGDPSDFCCSECGMRMFTNTNDTYTMIANDERTTVKRPNFCPNCGGRIEVD